MIYVGNFLSFFSLAYKLILMPVAVTLLWEAHVTEAAFEWPRAHVFSRVVHGIWYFIKLMQAHLALEQLVGPLRLSIKKLFCAPQFFGLWDAFGLHRVPLDCNSLVTSIKLHRFVFNFTWLYRLCFWKRWVSTCGCLCAGSIVLYFLLHLSYRYCLRESLRYLFGRLYLH